MSHKVTFYLGIDLERASKHTFETKSDLNDTFKLFFEFIHGYLAQKIDIHDEESLKDTMFSWITFLEDRIWLERRPGERLELILEVSVPPLAIGNKKVIEYLGLKYIENQ